MGCGLCSGSVGKCGVGTGRAAMQGYLDIGLGLDVPFRAC